MVEEDKLTSAIQPTSNKGSMETIMAFDYPFIKVPFEQARKVFRHSQRILEKDLGPLCKLDAVQAADLAELKKTVAELFKKMAEDDHNASWAFREKCEARLKNLNQCCHDPEALNKWDELRTTRFINEYLLSKGLFQTADLVSSLNNLTANALSDKEFYKQINLIEQKLSEGSTTECLQWCHENRAHLKKIASPLEFYLRRQTFVELARRRELMQAIMYGKKFFAPFTEQYYREIEQTTALLAIGPETEVRIYKWLYDPERWQDIRALFRKEIFDLNSLSSDPQLVSTLQAGLAALKTPNCGQIDDCNINCPVCTPPYADIAASLPFSHHENSSIVCRISGEVMNEDNPPMILPNGYVYSQQSLLKMAMQRDGMIRCPRSDEQFSLTEAQKMYIL